MGHRRRRCGWEAQWGAAARATLRGYGRGCLSRWSWGWSPSLSGSSPAPSVGELSPLSCSRSPPSPSQHSSRWRWCWARVGGVDGDRRRCAPERPLLAHRRVCRPVPEGRPFFRRALEGQTMVTTSWALAIMDGGRFDRAFMIGATLPQYAAWTVGTAVG